MLGVRLSISNQIKSSGVLGDFDPSKDAVPLSQLPPSDRYVLTAARTLLHEADAGYRSYRLRPVLTVRPAQVKKQAARCYAWVGSKPYSNPSKIFHARICVRQHCR